MMRILLINPNTAAATTDMMVAIARTTAGKAASIRGATATRGPQMITTVADLDAAAACVMEIGLSEAAISDGVIVGAFGDPGAVQLQQRLHIPVVGLCEAAMLEAASNRRRFAVATTTPELVARIDRSAARLGLHQHYVGTWLTRGDAFDLVADAPSLEIALSDVVESCIHAGGAEAVIIGGGPLSNAALSLAGRYDVPVIVPVAAAVRYLLERRQRR